jgi:hypothetical protein
MPVFETLTAIPESMTSGETVVWSESLPDFAQGTYTIAYNFAAHTTPVDGYESFQVSGSGSGTTWTFTITNAAAPKAGRYAWQQIVTRASDSAKLQIASGTLTVIPNLATAPTTSTAATLLSQLETAISTLTTTTNASVSFNGQSYTKKDMSRLLDDRTRLQAQVLRENRDLAALAGNPYDGNVSVEFTK